MSGLFYFAYGSNLCPQQMRARCPDSVFYSKGVLDGYALVFPRTGSVRPGGVASVAPQTKSAVEGVLYEISLPDLESLDRHEHVHRQSYFRTTMPVKPAEGRAVEAVVYTALPMDGGPFAPSADYLATIIRGARAHGLSPGYIATLEKTFQRLT